MTFAVFIPVQDYSTSTPGSIPLLFYLSGLTCTDENACQKLGAFPALSSAGLACVFPDTSPRGCGIQGESESWDFGVGAGFYLDATEEPWKRNWRMYSYCVSELPKLLSATFPCLDLTRAGITGHSMGGHGALVLALRNPTVFKSVSAFAPISNPSLCPWGKKAFTNYLGAGSGESWAQYDSTHLISTSSFDDILIDVGTADTFLKQGQLLPENLEAAASAAGKKITVRRQEDFGHDFYFYGTFWPDHVAHHKARLL